MRVTWIASIGLLGLLGTTACYRDADPPRTAEGGSGVDPGAPPDDATRDAPPPRKGFEWIPGHWARSGDKYVWLEGYFERAHAGHRWQPGRWTAVTAETAAGPAVQWAATVRDKSSEYSADGWSAEQALGPPNVYPQDGDMPQAWASLTADSSPEYLDLGYAHPMRAAGVDVYQTFNPGAVQRITLFTQDGQLHDFLAPPTTDTVLKLRVSCTSQPVIAVRVLLDSAAVGGWNEIDAVGLVPCT